MELQTSIQDTPSEISCSSLRNSLVAQLSTSYFLHPMRRIASDIYTNIYTSDVLDPSTGKSKREFRKERFYDHYCSSLYLKNISTPPNVYSLSRIKMIILNWAVNSKGTSKQSALDSERTALSCHQGQCHLPVNYCKNDPILEVTFNPLLAFNKHEGATSKARPKTDKQWT